MSFILNSIWQFWQTILDSLGFAGKEGSLIVLGLDNAGKTTFLYRLQTGGDLRSFPPTDRPSVQQFSIKTGGNSITSSGTNIRFTAWDLGGHEAVRHLWEDYVVAESISVAIFIIDAADTERLEEAAYELDSLICGQQGLLANVPVAILLNKCDLQEAMSTDEICTRIEFERLKEEHATGNTGELNIFRISVLNGEGFEEAFRWMSGFL